MRVELHPEARTELRAAALWYEERRVGLGDEFVSEISTLLARIGKAAESYPRWPGTDRAPAIVRKATLWRFPYLVAFEIHAADETNAAGILGACGGWHVLRRAVLRMREAPASGPPQGARGHMREGSENRRSERQNATT